MLKIELLKSPHPFAANTYLLFSEGEFAVVDPTAPFIHGLCEGRVKYVLLTHAHFDHILEVDSWVDATGAKVIISKDDQDALSDPERNCFKLYNGTENGYFGEIVGITENSVLPLGDTEIHFIKLPGHTIGSGAYLCEKHAFVGDTIFAGGGFGRFDLPTGSYVMLRDSIEKILALPEETIFYPGHGQTTTLKQFKQDFRR